MMKVRFGISINEEAVRALDEMVKEKGRFANRSQAIEYCVKQVLALERLKERSMEHLLNCLDLIEKHPEIEEKFKIFLKKELK